MPVRFGEEFLFGLMAGPAGGRLRRPSSAGRPVDVTRRAQYGRCPTLFEFGSLYRYRRPPRRSLSAITSDNNERQERYYVQI